MLFFLPTISLFQSSSSSSYFLILILIYFSVYVYFSHEVSFLEILLQKFCVSRWVLHIILLCSSKCKMTSLNISVLPLRVSENKVLKRIFGPRRDEVTGEWRRLRNEELNDLHPSPNIVRVIKSRKMRWAGHVAYMGEERGCIGSWWGNRKETSGET